MLVAAYFSQATLDSLNTIDNLPGVGDVSVPSGWFKNARASKARQGDGSGGGGREDSDGSSCQDPWAGVEPMTTTFRAQFSIDDVQTMAAQQQKEENKRWEAGGVVSVPTPTTTTQQTFEYGPVRQGLRGHGPPPPPPPPPLPLPLGSAAPGMSHPGPPASTPDAVKEFYRDGSPFTSQSSSSTSSEFEPSPARVFNGGGGGAPATPPHTQFGVASSPGGGGGGGGSPGGGGSVGGPGSGRNLVPLSFLTQIRQPARDPIAEDCLRRLTSTPRLEHRWSELRTTP